MRNLAIFFLLFIVRGTFAQDKIVHGAVLDQQGKPVRYAFIRDLLTKQATFTDSIGHFTLKVQPNSKLWISCRGYAAVFVPVKSNTTYKIKLQLTGTPNSMGKPLRADFSISQGDVGNGNQNFQYGSATFHNSDQEPTRGSRLFFLNWAHGFLIDNRDSLMANDEYLYNYDKIGGVLLFTQDGKTARDVERERAKSFTLFSDSGKTAVFEYVPEIDDKSYVEVLASGKEYKIFKLIKTDFNKADYSTNGISSSGNKYDEYVDRAEYYLLNESTGKTQKMLLREKSLKKAFVDDIDKFNQFSATQSGPIDDDYLARLGEFMNQ